MSKRTKSAHPKPAPQKDKPAPQKDERWVISRIRGTPAAMLGFVYAPDQETAIDRATEQFRVRPELRDRLIARRG